LKFRLSCSASKVKATQATPLGDPLHQSSALPFFLPAFAVDPTASFEFDTGALLRGNGELAKDTDSRLLSLFLH
jgi:hypothetical protein